MQEKLLNDHIHYIITAYMKGNLRFYAELLKINTCLSYKVHFYFYFK